MVLSGVQMQWHWHVGLYKESAKMGGAHVVKWHCCYETRIDVEPILHGAGLEGWHRFFHVVTAVPLEDQVTGGSCSSPISSMPLTWKQQSIPSMTIEHVKWCNDKWYQNCILVEQGFRCFRLSFVCLFHVLCQTKAQFLKRCTFVLLSLPLSCE